MQRIAVTGHVDVSEDVAKWVVTKLTERLGGVLGPRVHGITCLAKGADQIFATVILTLRGTFEVVLPAHDYHESMVHAEDGERFTQLLARASRVETMPFDKSSRAAYLAASEEMLDRCDVLLAVWDGNPSRDVGDTADIVRKARERDVPVEVLWPDGAVRTGGAHASGVADD